MKIKLQVIVKETKNWNLELEVPSHILKIKDKEEFNDELNDWYFEVINKTEATDVHHDLFVMSVDGKEICNCDQESNYEEANSN